MAQTSTPNALPLEPFPAAKVERIIKARARDYTAENNAAPDNAACEAGRGRRRAMRDRADALCAPYGVELDWGVGLYPVPRFRGHDYHGPLTATLAKEIADAQLAQVKAQCRAAFDALRTYGPGDVEAELADIFYDTNADCVENATERLECLRNLAAQLGVEIPAEVRA